MKHCLHALFEMRAYRQMLQDYQDTSVHFALSFVEGSTFHKMHEHMILFYFQADKPLNDFWVVDNIQFVYILNGVLILSFPVKKPPISFC